MALLAVLALGAAACGGSAGPAPSRGGRASAASIPVAKVVGQTILVRMPGRRPTATFLARIRAGQIGGVVLFSENFGPAGPAALDAELQAAARAGGNPPLLIAIDQEGGIVKRLPGAPTLAPGEMSTPAVAAAQGQATAKNLSRFGISMDLAPVLDVGHGGFITPRTFGSTPQVVATRGTAFARGLAAGRVAATAKHFPGLGYARVSTDASSVVVGASRSALLADLLPFRTAIRSGVPLVMVSTAAYPALGATEPAALSATIVKRLFCAR